MSAYLNQFNTSYIEELLAQYQTDPNSIDPSWRYFFDGLEMGGLSTTTSGQISEDDLRFELRVIELIQAYRNMGYVIADINPLDRGTKTHPLLDHKNFGLSDSDLGRVSHAGKALGLGLSSVREIITSLKTYYCSPAAVEMSHIEDPQIRQWIQSRVESRVLLRPLELAQKMRTLEMLTKAEIFEQFIHKRFVGQKRFSLEGTDVIIPMLDYIINMGCELGTDDFLLGMAHRGRLGVLAHTLQKDIKSMFAEFLGNLEVEDSSSDGDVKYHMGYSLDLKTPTGKEAHISLAPNPSHLEAVNCVVLGKARAKQKMKNDTDFNRTLVVLLHGDAAFSGQGSIYEMLNMSELKGYTVGGAVHIITNNQIGFTTLPGDSRSTKNATDIAQMLQIPIFRVNADEQEAALRVIDMALEFRYTFKKDVVIDVIGYRRFGHNEGDEPSFTQPLMYKKINEHPTALQIYAEKLDREGVITRSDSQKMADKLFDSYDDIINEVKKKRYSPKMTAFEKRWEGFTEQPTGESFFQSYPTGIDKDTIQKIMNAVIALPKDFKAHPKIVRLLSDKSEMIEGKRGFDWACGEALAFGSLLLDGFPIRLAGQDSIRGTFSHRHAVYYDTESGNGYCPLNNLKGIKGDLEVFNSLLSEMGALAFEYGQSLTNPKKLVLWEAQFGDFVNGAQIIIDQFITSSAFKWQRHSGLVMLLPHGYEGQGPEHSSARLERFLQATAQNNIQVCNLTTPAQYFHILRRQMMRKFKLPLIIMSPKSLLRHPKAVSSYDDIEKGVFQEILDDADLSLKNRARRVIMCSGKVYYDLLATKEKLGNTDTAIVRVEQFYPISPERLAEILGGYTRATDLVWCQEEPQNMGGWWFMYRYIEQVIPSQMKLRYAGRAPQASPAVGYTHIFQAQQEQLTMKAFGEN